MVIERTQADKPSNDEEENGSNDCGNEHRIASPSLPMIANSGRYKTGPYRSWMCICGCSGVGSTLNSVTRVIARIGHWLQRF
jgi:hypothetical protein